MLAFGRIIFLFAGLLLLVDCSFAQTVTVQSITIHGLKRTKASIVYRELTFAEGDTIKQSDLGTVLERASNNLLNMGIFNAAVVNVAEWDTQNSVVDIKVEVKESWYIYAVPILELADRNFNVWWTTYNHSLDRLNLGGRLDWLNFTGRNDKIKAKIQVGYTPKQELDYRLPYLNKKQSVTMSTGFSHSINKEISFITADNREQFVQLDERVLQQRFQANVKAFYRPSIFLQYELNLAYQYLKVEEEIVTDFNPLFFSNGDSTHSVFSLRGVFQYDDRDFKLFPARGLKAAIEFEKIGLRKGADEDMLISILTLEWNVTSGRKFQHRFSSVSKYSFTRSRPSHIYYRGLGSGVKYVSGYELYIIDGLDFTLGKYQLAYKLLDKETDLGSIMLVDQFRKIKYALYLSVLAEAGYANDPHTGATNSLANQWLFGGGPAITLMMYNNFLFQFSYSVNHLGEKGIFIHNRTSF